MHFTLTYTHTEKVMVLHIDSRPDAHDDMHGYFDLTLSEFGFLTSLSENWSNFVLQFQFGIWTGTMAADRKRLGGMVTAKFSNGWV